MTEINDRSQSLRDLSPLTLPNKENDQLSSILSSVKELKRDLSIAKREIAEIKAKQSQSATQADCCMQNMERLIENVSRVDSRLDDIDFIKFDIAQMKAKQSQTSTQVTSGFEHLSKITGDISQVSSRLGEMNAMRFDVNELKGKGIQTSSQMATCMDYMHRLADDFSHAQSRLSEVDYLKLDIQLLQKRIKLVEDENRRSQMYTHTNHPEQPQTDSIKTSKSSANPNTQLRFDTRTTTMPPPTKPASAYTSKDKPLRSIEAPVETAMHHVLISPHDKRHSLSDEKPHRPTTTRPSSPPPDHDQSEHPFCNEDNFEVHYPAAKRRRTGSQVPQTPKPRGRPRRSSSVVPERSRSVSMDRAVRQRKVPERYSG